MPGECQRRPPAPLPTITNATGQLVVCAPDGRLWECIEANKDRRIQSISPVMVITGGGSNGSNNSTAVSYIVVFEKSER
jgi:hypothetical protein